MKYDVVGIGTAAWDILNTPIGRMEASGGAVLNSIIRMHELGLDSTMISRVGSDDYGKKVLDYLKERSIDTSSMRIDKEPTSVYEIDITPDDRIIKRVQTAGTNFFQEDDKKILDQSISVFLNIKRDDFDKIAEHCISNNVNVFATMHGVELDLDQAETYGRRLTQYRPELIFANENEYDLCKDSLEEARELGSVIAVTRGKRGCEILDEKYSSFIPGFSVKPVDPTGAGDAFAAGFIRAYLKGNSVKDAGVFGNAMGALATQHYGAVAEKITLDDALKLIGMKYPDFSI